MLAPKMSRPFGLLLTCNRFENNALSWDPLLVHRLDGPKRARGTLNGSHVCLSYNQNQLDNSNSISIPN